MEVVKFKKNEIIFQEEDSIKYVYLVIEGIIKVTKMNQTGEEKIVDILCDNEYVAAILAFKKKEKYELNAYALNDTVCKKFTIEEFDNYIDNKINRNHFLDFAFNKTTFFKRLVEVTNSQDELILTLLKMMKKKFDNNNDYFTLPLSKSDLASLMGIRRETFSRKISKLCEEKIIDNDGNTYKFLK